MSVNIIENWTDILGRVSGLDPDSEVGGFTAVQMEVQSAAAVEDFANLLEGTEGESVQVLFPDERVAELGLREGLQVACRVRRAGLRRIYVHRDHIAVEDGD